MTTDPLQTLEKTQRLCSQVSHDIISLFTSLSAGLDVVSSNIQENQDIWALLHQAKSHLHTQLLLTRFLLSYGEGSPEEGKHILTAYGKIKGVSVEGHFSLWPKLSLGLGFWLIRHYQRTHPASLSPRLKVEDTQLELFGPFHVTDEEEKILIQGQPSMTVHHSYAAYLYQLAHAQGQGLLLHKTPQSAKIALAPLQSSQ